MTKPNKLVLLVFSLLITPLYGCVPTSTPIQSTFTPESTLTLTPTVTASATPESLTIEVIDNLNFEQRKAFAIALDAEKDAQRGDNPIIFKGQVHKLDSEENYIDPLTGDYLPVDNGTTAKEQTIDNTKPIAFDDEGFAHVFYNGEWIKLAGSQNIQFDNFENFKWPNTDIVNPESLRGEHSELLGLTIPEAYFRMNDGNPRNMTPIFFLDDRIGQINLFGIRAKATIFGFTLNAQDPYSSTMTIITDAVGLYENGVGMGGGGGFTKTSDFFQELEKNTIYYLIYKTNQYQAFKTAYPQSISEDFTKNYTGLAPLSSTHQIITGASPSNDIPMVSGRGSLIVKPGN